MPTTKTCLDCKFCVKRDYGYSNWTVEDTTLSCLKDLNPAFPQSETYAWKIKADEGVVVPELRAAETCPGFVAGDGPWFDVDGKATANDYKDDPDVYALLKANNYT